MKDNIKDNIRERGRNIREKSKNRLFKLVFGRTLLIMLAVLVQVILWLAFTIWLNEYFVYFSILSTVLTAILVIHIANNDINPAYKMAWEYLVLSIPVFGSLFYVLIKIHPGRRFLKERMIQIADETKPYLVQNENVLEELKNSNDELYGLAKYVSKYAGYPCLKNSKTKYFPLGEDMFEEMLVQLRQAKEFIFLEYYIVDDGVMWDSILDILCDKVEEGVEVRFMYDGMCTMKLLPHDYPKDMEKLGIKCKVYSPIRPAISTYQNNRDHRKICVIDGRVAFTGGVNLSDEYININSKFGHWKDTAIMLEGEAVNNFTMMFLQVWNITEKQKEDYAKYIRKSDVSAKGYVIPYSDNPYNKENVGEFVYMDILNNARDYVHIMTPYLVIDNEMLMCLEYAAKRGVDVKIILPHITDNPTEYKIARNLYPRLLERGIKIYEYTPGFVHAKTFVSDNKKAVVGTINLDFRSMYLNMECAAYIQGMDEILKIEEDFNDTLAKCEEITMENCEKYSKVKAFIGKVLWIMSPLM